MFSFLNLNKKPNVGITLIITPKWMFLSPIENPYHFEKELNIPGHDLENGVPVYLDGFAYGGVFNIQT